MLDVMSGGRIVAGFPVGTPMDTTLLLRPEPGHAAREVPRGRRPDPARVDESDDRSRSTASTPSSATSTSWPRPIQQPHPPVWIPGGGSVETWDWCARNDFLYAYLSYFGYLRRARRWTASGTRSSGTGSSRIRIAPASCSSSGSPTRDAEAERLYGERRSTSTTAACTSTRLRRPAWLHVDRDDPQEHREPGQSRAPRRETQI